MSSSLLGNKRFVDPATVVTHFHIREGDVVADFGAGSGYYIEPLARLVGQTGKVYACEIQRELVNAIGALARSKGLHGVTPLWCDLETIGGSKIADGVLDIGLMINVLFQLEDKKTALAEIARTVRSGGKFFLIDWTDSFGGLGPHPEQVFPSDAAKALVEGSGFIYERTFDAGDHHYGLAFRRI